MLVHVLARTPLALLRPAPCAGARLYADAAPKPDAKDDAPAPAPKRATKPKKAEATDGSDLLPPVCVSRAAMGVVGRSLTLPGSQCRL